MTLLTVERLDPVTGYGIAFHDGAALALPFAAPGDRAALSDDGLSLRSADSAVRRTPRCPHFGACGGCSLQHVADGFVADWKRGIVRDALARHGVDAPVAPTLTVPPSSRRRARLTLHRTKKSAAFGFRAARDHRVVDVETCAILTPMIVEALPLLRGIALAGAPRKRAVTLQVTQTDTGLDVLAEGMKDADLALRERLAALAERADLARLVWNGQLMVERRPPALRFGPATVRPPPGAFLQAARETETLVLDLLRDALAGSRGIADLFCGCGTFSLPLAETMDVTAIDADPALVAALDGAARACPALRPVAARVRDLFRDPLPADDLAPFDAVVVDPPRAGARAQALRLADSAVPVVAMVSCNPDTFARDAGILARGGYLPGTVTPIDQFRWSPHTEVVGIFRRA